MCWWAAWSPRCSMLAGRGCSPSVLRPASKTFQLLLSIGAGTGLIYLLRWFWWRINAWSEISAMASSFIVSAGFFIAAKQGHGVPSHISLLVTVASTTVVWLIVTYLTKPTDAATLETFYRLVRPAGPGWTTVRAATGLGPSPDSLSQAMLGWVLGCLFVYAALFGTGSILYGKWPQAWMWIVVFIVSGGWLVRLLPRMWGKGTELTIARNSCFCRSSEARSASWARARSRLWPGRSVAK